MRVSLRHVMMMAVLAGLTAGVALPARADDDDRRPRREREFRDRERHDRGEHRGWRRDRDDYYVAPAPVYAPPPVVYSPPPAPAGLSLFFNFR